MMPVSASSLLFLTALICLTAGFPLAISPGDDYEVSQPRLQQPWVLPASMDTAADSWTKSRLDLPSGLSDLDDQEDQADEDGDRVQEWGDEDMPLLTKRKQGISSRKMHYSRSRSLAGLHQWKRSANCLRKCMAQGLLHPAQCHSLC